MKLADLKFKPKSYLAFEIASASRNTLLKKFPPKFSKIFCHHVTIEFRITEESLEKVKERLGLGKIVLVTGYLGDESLECLSVEIDKQNKRMDDSYYHITHSLNDPRKPVQSNDLIRKSHGVPHHKIEPIHINGVYRLITLSK